MNTKVKPTHEIRFGAIKAAIWENKTPSGIRHSVVVNRLYKQEDHWKVTQSFGRDDLPLVSKVVQQAHTWIFEQQRKPEVKPAK